MNKSWVPLVALIAVTSLGVTLRGQTRPDFTGTWVVEHVDTSGGSGEASRPDGGGRGGPGGGRGGGLGRPGGPGGQGGRGGGGRGGGRGGDRPEGAPAEGRRGPGMGAMYHVGDVVTLKQTVERLIVTREGEGGAVMTSDALDGSETKGAGADGGTSTTKSRWEGVALVTELSTAVESPRGKRTMKSREVRTLGEDWNAMTLTVALDTPRGKQLSTVTFGRRESAR